jgi:hypothetical protein
MSIIRGALLGLLLVATQSCAEDDLLNREGSGANRIDESVRVVGAKRTDDPR